MLFKFQLNIQCNIHIGLASITYPWSLSVSDLVWLKDYAILFMFSKKEEGWL